MKRRTWLRNMGGVLLTAPLAGSGNFFSTSRPALRIAHLTDIHLKDKWDAPRRFVKCLHHVQQQSPKVDMILNGGDVVFDMNKENMDVINAQWKLMQDTLAAECSLPVHYTLGNHDIWWNEADRGQAIYGKKYSMDKLGLTAPYYSFTKGGWKFIILDSVHLDLDNTWYIGKLGDAQMDWLTTTLENTPATTPVLVMTHIPILSATGLIDDNTVNRWTLTGANLMTDNAKIIRLFYQHPNVKICLSGHIHLRDKVVYNDVTYLCNGAVSGAWWEGNKRETAPGYGLLDLYADGTFTESYVNY